MLDALLVAPNNAHASFVSVPMNLAPDFSSFDPAPSGATPPSSQVTPTKSEDLPAPSLDLPFTAFDDDLDHRKRRRNRTTQSCWSCHQAKRKCDRKRPCSRCIQLGLTGLCVYETDDPSARDDPTLSETQRLRKRIAELEALVREMKNKPHPRWAEKVSPGAVGGGGGGIDKWHTRAKYASGAAGGGAGAGSPDAFEDYQYRFPPLDGAGSTAAGYDSASTTMDDLTSGRRLSIASSSQSSSNSSPRTPYYSPLSNPPHALASNPCTCLNTSPTLARTLSSSLRSILLDAGSSIHPYTEGCRVLALVRELESIASSNAASHSHSHSHSHPHPSSTDFYATSGSGASSPSPSSIHQHQQHSHPHPHTYHPHLTRPPTLSYASYPTLSSLTMATYHQQQQQQHAYTSPSSDDGSGRSGGGENAFSMAV